MRLLLTSFILTAVFFVSGQTTYEWDEFGVGFELADDFSVVTDNAESWELISSDEEIFISVMPWADEEVTLDDLEEATYWIAVDMVFGDGLDEDEVDGDCGEINDFDACYVIGAVYDRDWDFYLIALMMDTESDTNLLVSLAFNEGDEDEVVDMMSSFYAYD